MTKGNRSEKQFEGNMVEFNETFKNGFIFVTKRLVPQKFKKTVQVVDVFTNRSSSDCPRVDPRDRLGNNYKELNLI